MLTSISGFYLYNISVEYFCKKKYVLHFADLAEKLIVKNSNNWENIKMKTQTKEILFTDIFGKFVFKRLVSEEMGGL